MKNNNMKFAGFNSVGSSIGKENGKIILAIAIGTKLQQD